MAFKVAFFYSFFSKGLKKNIFIIFENTLEYLASPGQPERNVLKRIKIPNAF
jgi:hypothetical protein